MRCYDIAGNDQIRLCKSALVKIKKYIYLLKLKFGLADTDHKHATKLLSFPALGPERVSKPPLLRVDGLIFRIPRSRRTKAELCINVKRRGGICDR